MGLRENLGIGAVIGTQILVLCAIPARTLVTRATGREITLRTAPVDPYDPLAGYYVTLSYEVERPDKPERDQLGSARPIWITVRKAQPIWERVAMSAERPAPAPDQVSLRAHWDGWRATIDGAGRLYIPETQRDVVAELLGKQDQHGLVDLKVSDDGDVAVLRLRVGGATFGDSK